MLCVLPFDPANIHPIDIALVNGEVFMNLTATAAAAAVAALQHPLDALRLALDPANIHPIDIALVNGEVFMNLTTAGPVSEVSSKGMSDALKKALGPAAVAVAGGEYVIAI
eukprot:GHUV01018647.1.p2 GENE.GHUV01018647.1~~GHUV01018647.1.p2  ORF type:complete len:111 (-),score=34.21 GHUV01018647.1:141-473(-)